MSKDRLNDYISHVDTIHELIKARQEFVGNYRTDDETTPGVAEGNPQDSSTATNVTSDYDNTSTLNSSVTSSGFVVPSGVNLTAISGGKVLIPSGSRREIHKKRIQAGNASNFAGYVPVSKDKFWFVESVGGKASVQNQFAPDFAEVLYLLYDALVQVGHTKPGGKIQINSGFRLKPVGAEWSAHRCGCAVDIGISGSKERYLVADTAWGLGLRAIAVANGFVHVDNGVGAQWKYSGVPKYVGPGK